MTVPAIRSASTAARRAAIVRTAIGVRSVVVYAAGRFLGLEGSEQQRDDDSDHRKQASMIGYEVEHLRIADQSRSKRLAASINS